MLEDGLSFWEVERLRKDIRQAALSGNHSLNEAILSLLPKGNRGRDIDECIVALRETRPYVDELPSWKASRNRLSNVLDPYRKKVILKDMILEEAA